MINTELRKLRKKELGMVIHWRNHEMARMYSVNQGELTMDHMNKWFKDPNVIKFLFLANKQPMGVLALKAESEDILNWSFYMNVEDELHKNLVSIMLTCGIYLLKQTGIEKVKAFVHEDNKKSIVLHERLGFTETHQKGKFIYYEKKISWLR